MKRNLVTVIVMVLLAGSATISGCARGEEDPWFTLHSRDGRISQTWALSGLSGSVVKTTNGTTTNIEYYFDGTNLYITTDGVTQSYSYRYDMDVKDNGDVFSQEFMNDIIDGSIVSQSSQTSYWYWGNDDQNKTSVTLDLTGLFSAYLSYDLPRLAWNDMTFSVDYSDNYTELVQINDTTFEYQAGSETVLMEMDWEVNLDGL